MYMYQYKKPITVAILCLVFSTLFLFNTKRDFPLIFKKDLLAHDESSNSVVAANITRKFFPPMVRVNPLNEEQGNWMEGPYWQHIPPMFAYVPYVFFELDGEVTIEVKRLAFAFMIWLTGILFITLIYAYSSSIWAVVAATLATIFWINTPFTHELITGYAFGVSDIVLAFTVILGLDGVLWYLHKEKEGRLQYPWWKIGIMAIFVAMPILAKNLLGAIPAAIFFISLSVDYKGLSKKVLTAVSFFAGIIALYYLPLFLISPETFKSEILISFFHATDYEGWGRPWHYYISNYLPQRYLFGWAWVYFVGLIFATWYTFFGKLERIQKLLLAIPLLWFVWNLVAISFIESKIANFIFQSYLLSLFAIVYSIFEFARSVGTWRSALRYEMIVIPTLIVAILAMGYETIRFVQQFNFQRAQGYTYQTLHEKFYEVSEKMRDEGISEKDLVIVNVSQDDCWARYYILFLTGAEAKTLLEMHFNTVPYTTINQRYSGIYYLDKNLAFGKIDTDSIQQILQTSKSQIEEEIVRIKKDKTACQWLVPDAILNAT